MCSTKCRGEYTVSYFSANYLLSCHYDKSDKKTILTIAFFLVQPRSSKPFITQ